MPQLKYDNRLFNSREGETVLEASLRNGVVLPFSCRSGICQVCLQRCVSGCLPEAAQRGVKPELRAKGYFLPCCCMPTGDMVIAPPCDEDLFTSAIVHDKRALTDEICQVLLDTGGGFGGRAGQFINLRQPGGVARSYSLAADPVADYFLELHVRRMPGGQLSNWIFHELKVGDVVDIQGPMGCNYYAAGDSQQPLLLIGSGTGLAPLLGIVRDALVRGHCGDIFLYHGVRDPYRLYMHHALLELGAKHANFHYVPCVSGAKSGVGTVRGRAHEVALAQCPDLRGWRVHLAGRAEMVFAAERQALKAGAAPAEVFADAFELTDRRRKPRGTAASDRRSRPLPDPEMWEALGQGELMGSILEDFYTRVFEDLLLSPYFRGVTKRRLVEKVYSFMCQIFTGTQYYFGDRPRNAHHWMVIPDDLFDHRERLMRDSLRRHNLAPHLIARWLAIEESFRPDIVKTEPWPRVVGGVALPMEGFDEIVLDVGSICDSCGAEISAGTRVRYHVRLGSTYCPCCHSA